MRFLVLTLLANFCVTFVNAEPIAVAIERINSVRASAALPSLTQSPTLNQVAQMHARDMMVHGFVSHKGSDGSQLSNRVQKVGYQYCFVAENIDVTRGSFSQVIDKWQSYPPARKVLFHRKAREVGIAHVGDGIWVMVLARPGCDYATS
jgi:uncharacterized protein YkwD